MQVGPGFYCTGPPFNRSSRRMGNLFIVFLSRMYFYWLLHLFGCMAYIVLVLPMYVPPPENSPYRGTQYHRVAFYTSFVLISKLCFAVKVSVCIAT